VRSSAAVFALAAALLGADTAPDAGAPDAGPPAAPVSAIPADLAARLRAMDEATRALRDATCTFYKREYKGGQLEQEVILLKVRSSPRATYLKWIGDEYTDREVIWREGWNDGELRAHKGSFPDFTLDLAVDSRLAMYGTRHPVTLAGFAFTVEMLVRDFRLLDARPECLLRFADLGVQQVRGAASRCIDAELDKERCPALYGRRARVCVHEQLALPTSVEIWDLEDGEVRLVEEYGYEQISVDTGLTDLDFDPENPAYDF
jgi:hypothetical protein